MQTEREWECLGILLMPDEVEGLGIPEPRDVTEEVRGRISGRATEAKWGSNRQGDGHYEKVLNFPLDDWSCIIYFLDPESEGFDEVNRIGGWTYVLKVLRYDALEPEFCIILDLPEWVLLFKLELLALDFPSCLSPVSVPLSSSLTSGQRGRVWY